MSKNKRIIVRVRIVLLIIVIGIVVAYKLMENNVTNREYSKYNVENISPNPVDTVNQEQALDPQIVTWEEITADGVNEELLLKNVDEELLTEIAAELQTLIEEAKEEERKNPEIVITEGWARVWEYERYKKVLHIGSPAMKPLYLILYKSPNAGEYEYLCARILYELSGFDFEWTNSRDFLEGFNQKIIESRQ